MFPTYLHQEVARVQTRDLARARNQQHLATIAAASADVERPVCTRSRLARVIRPERRIACALHECRCATA